MNPRDRRFAALADRVRAARVAKGMTQRHLSLALKMSAGYVGHLESGRSRPTTTTLRRLSLALGLLYGDLALEAGYITRQEFESPIDDQQLARLVEISDLTDDEWDSVKDFARYVRSRSRGRG